MAEISLLRSIQKVKRKTLRGHTLRPRGIGEFDANMATAIFNMTDAGSPVQKISFLQEAR